MGWGGLDKLLTYSFKSALRVVHYFESSKWERARALITGHDILYPIWGCSSVKLHYRFDLEDRLIKGWDVIPFPALPQAKYYAESFTHNMPRIIRVNPNNPEKTHFFERDQ